MEPMNAKGRLCHKLPLFLGWLPCVCLGANCGDRTISFSSGPGFPGQPCLPRRMLDDSGLRGFTGFIYLVQGILISLTVTPSLAPSVTTTYRGCEWLPLATFKQSAHMESAFPPSYVPGI